MPCVLIVDDEIENLESLKRSLGDDNPGWKILIARNEAEGKAILKKQIDIKEPVDVVLTDLVMDCEASGMNIIKEARKLDPLVMSIIFTAKEKSLDRYAAFDYGAFDVVEKNIRGQSAAREINVKTRAAFRYREWSQSINLLRRYFDPRVFEAIERDPKLLSLNRRTLTIAFWDVRGFSRLCDSLKAHPDLIAGFLKDYCEVAAKTIFKHNGVLDKFIGDGVMALFGVMQASDDDGISDAISTVHAAIELRSKFDEVRSRWIGRWERYIPDKIEIGLGCGIHTGEVLVGNVGTDFRDQFTALGTHVNFASRIESRSKDGQILISQSTQTRVRSTISTSIAEEVSDIKGFPGTYILYKPNY